MSVIPDEESVYTVENVEEYKDIISELNPRFPHIIAQILQYLSVRELCLMSCICKSWRNALSDSTLANQRRLKHIKKIRKLRRSVGQENWPIKKRTPVPASTRRDALSDIRNVYRTRKPKRSATQSHNTTAHSLRVRDMGLRAMR